MCVCVCVCAYVCASGTDWLARTNEPSQRAGEPPATAFAMCAAAAASSSSSMCTSRFRSLSRCCRRRRPSSPSRHRRSLSPNLAATLLRAAEPASRRSNGAPLRHPFGTFSPPYASTQRARAHTVTCVFAEPASLTGPAGLRGHDSLALLAADGDSAASIRRAHGGLTIAGAMGLARAQ